MYKRQIQHLRDELKEQSDQTETSLAKAAQTFNQLAEQLKQPTPSTASPTTPPSNEESTPEPEASSDEPTPRRGRRRGMFGGDLTLDD